MKDQNAAIILKFLELLAGLLDSLLVRRCRVIFAGRNCSRILEFLYFEPDLPFVHLHPIVRTFGPASKLWLVRKLHRQAAQILFK